MCMISMVMLDHCMLGHHMAWPGRRNLDQNHRTVINIIALDLSAPLPPCVFSFFSDNLTCLHATLVYVFRLQLIQNAISWAALFVLFLGKYNYVRIGSHARIYTKKKTKTRKKHSLVPRRPVATWKLANGPIELMDHASLSEPHAYASWCDGGCIYMVLWGFDRHRYPTSHVTARIFGGQGQNTWVVFMNHERD